MTVYKPVYIKGGGMTVQVIPLSLAFFDHTCYFTYNDLDAKSHHKQACVVTITIGALIN